MYVPSPRAEPADMGRRSDYLVCFFDHHFHQLLGLVFEEKFGNVLYSFVFRIISFLNLLTLRFGLAATAECRPVSATTSSDHDLVPAQFPQ